VKFCTIYIEIREEYFFQVSGASHAPYLNVLVGGDSDKCGLWYLDLERHLHSYWCHYQLQLILVHGVQENLQRKRTVMAKVTLWEATYSAGKYTNHSLHSVLTFPCLLVEL